MGRIDWTDQENDAIVADYFAMLGKELAGQAFNKSAHRRELQKTVNRSHGSIEYKHQNISAVLKGLGETWITGYLPAFNIQGPLIDAVARHLALRPMAALGFREPRAQFKQPLIFGAPPTMSNAPEPKAADELSDIARRFDVAARQERNRALGRAGEEQVLHHEKVSLERAGRKDLAREVRWVSDLDGDGAGYDISSFDFDGRPRLIEVKTTNGWNRTPFHISRNEIAVSRANPDSWCLVRVWNFARAPEAFELRPPLDRHVSLMPTSFQADFRQ